MDLRGKLAAVRRPKRAERAQGREGTEGGRESVPAAGPPVHPALRALAMLAAFAGTVLFSLVLARVTLEPSAASAGIAHSNTHPGASIGLYLDGRSVREAAEQLGGNVLLGVPFGVLLPVLLPQARGLLRVVAVTAVVMTLVELIQGALVAGRAFDVDDVILNTAGALLGYLLLGRRLGRAVHPRRRHWWHSLSRRRAPAPPTDPLRRRVYEACSRPGPMAAGGAGGRRPRSSPPVTAARAAAGASGTSSLTVRQYRFEPRGQGADRRAAD
ncbi:VanZ family protein [Streptomyces sp. NPDC004126]|uniref:VanZ family protein n=1 Tax=Streptomyces sp. NPDC004126 TaxID=3390695 RepID=UPI003D05E5F8